MEAACRRGLRSRGYTVPERVRGDRRAGQGTGGQQRIRAREDRVRDRARNSMSAPTAFAMNSPSRCPRSPPTWSWSRSRRR